MGRDVASNGFTIVIVLAVALAILAGWTRNAFINEGPLTEAIYFDVERGARLDQISENLADAGAVSSALLFRLNTRFQDRAQDLNFGTFEIPAGASMTEVLDIVTQPTASVERYRATYQLRPQGTGVMRLTERRSGTGERVELARFTFEEGVPEVYSDLVDRGGVNFWVQVPEGLTSWAIVEGLRQAPFLSGEINDLPTEGMLAPDTYNVSRGFGRSDLLARMEAAQADILEDLWAARADGLPLQSPEGAIILASIVQKETAVASELPQVASVFINRINEGMRLDADSTTIYGMTGGEWVEDLDITNADLDEQTPWNTRAIGGLPITAIAHPGRDAIEAVLNPADTPYFYFVADGTGGHAFAETLREHNVNVQRWLEIERQQSDGG